MCFKDFSFVGNSCGNGILLYTIFLCHTFLRTFCFFNFLQSLTFFCYRNVYSFHLSHLFRPTSLFMEDRNFVILNIRILIRSTLSDVSQGKHYIADISKKVFCWLCHKVWKRRMDLVEKLVTAKNYQ